MAVAATADRGGYWMVAADGGVFTFGDATYHGSMGGHHLNKPIVGFAPAPGDRGYWEVAADGGIFAFNAPFLGSMGAVKECSHRGHGRRWWWVHDGRPRWGHLQSSAAGSTAVWSARRLLASSLKRSRPASTPPGPRTGTGCSASRPDVPWDNPMRIYGFGAAWMPGYGGPIAPLSNGCTVITIPTSVAVGQSVLVGVTIDPTIALERCHRVHPGWAFLRWHHRGDPPVLRGRLAELHGLGA